MRIAVNPSPSRLDFQLGRAPAVTRLRLTNTIHRVSLEPISLHQFIFCRFKHLIFFYTIK
jgi:hypothetical protein